MLKMLVSLSLHPIKNKKVPIHALSNFKIFFYRLVELGMGGSMALAASYFTHNKHSCISRWKKLKERDMK